MAPKKYLGLRGSRLRMAMLVLVVAPSFVLFGYNNGSTGGISSLPSFVKQFPILDVESGTTAQKSHNATIKGAVTGCYDLGAVIGSLLSMLFSDRIGRLRTLLVGLVLSVVALAVEASAFSIAQFVVGRLLIGGAIGIVSAIVPVWQSECSSTAHRGAFVIMEGLCISSGITLSEWVAYGLSFARAGPVQWRVPLAFPAVFALFVMPVVLAMPESPRWLARVGRVDEARAVLAALADADEDAGSVEAELRGIQHSLAVVQGSLRELAHNGEERVLHRTLLACTGQVFQQMCGISALVFYTSTIFVDLGFAGDRARLLGACLTTFQTCASVVPIFLVDRLGRRRLFMAAGTGLCISCAIIAATGGDKGHAGIAAVVFVFAYDFFYPLGFLGQTFLYATEVSPLRLRVPIAAISNSVQWLCQYAVAQSAAPGMRNLGGHRFWIIFAVLNASFVPIVYFFFPETKGRSLEEMDVLFKHCNSVFDTVSVAKSLAAEQARQEVGVVEPEAKSQVSGSEEAGLAGHGGSKKWVEQAEEL